MNHKIGRNDPCPCGSERKYKKCCIGKESKRNTFYLSNRNKKNMYILRKARKEHECDNCQNIILANDEYYSLNIAPKLLSMAARDLPSTDIVVKKSCISCFQKRMLDISKPES
ncbi:MAG: hypothetical protein E4G94_03805 [ANME-2 cluster archaeon]|nr:MAG: hypothetical protein E4G94_03805 [ANME-2 cluster archaeon]